MRRIIFHIGTHKTGTTSIQHGLFDNRKSLSEAGLFYPDIEFGPEPRHRKHMGLFSALLKGGDTAQASMTALCNAFQASGADTMILSEEALCYVPLKQPNTLDVIAKLRSEYEIQSICFLRRPDYFIESLWNQMCSEGRTKMHIRAFYQAEFAMRYLRYDAFLSEWSKVSEVTALGFEASRETGVVPAFCDSLGIPSLPVDAAKNVSPSMSCAAVLAALRRTSDQSYKMKQIEKELGPDLRKTALGRRLRRKILHDFADQREILERKYGVVFPTDLPEEPLDMLHRPTDAEVACFQDRRFVVLDRPAVVQGRPADLTLTMRIKRKLNRLRKVI